MRFILDCEHVDRHTRLAHCNGVANEIARKIAIVFRFQPTLDQATAGLHPRRSAPRCCDDFQLRVDRPHGLQCGDQVCPCWCNVRQRISGDIGIAVMALRKIGCADGNSRHAKPQTGRSAEQFAHQCLPRVFRQFGLDQIGTGIGNRSTEPGNLLKSFLRVDDNVRVLPLGNLDNFHILHR